MLDVLLVVHTYLSCLIKVVLAKMVINFDTGLQNLMHVVTGNKQYTNDDLILIYAPQGESRKWR